VHQLREADRQEWQHLLKIWSREEHRDRPVVIAIRSQGANSLAQLDIVRPDEDPGLYVGQRAER